jgi:hypothetical protein
VFALVGSNLSYCYRDKNMEEEGIERLPIFVRDAIYLSLKGKLKLSAIEWSSSSTLLCQFAKAFLQSFSLFRAVLLGQTWKM